MNRPAWADPEIKTLVQSTAENVKWGLMTSSFGERGVEGPKRTTPASLPRPFGSHLVSVVSEEPAPESGSYRGSHPTATTQRPGSEQECPFAKATAVRPVQPRAKVTFPGQ